MDLTDRELIEEVINAAYHLGAASAKSRIDNPRWAHLEDCVGEILSRIEASRKVVAPEVPRSPACPA
jgi:hypothetical protein